jgi:predicted small metal-binding protein
MRAAVLHLAFAELAADRADTAKRTDAAGRACPSSVEFCETARAAADERGGPMTMGRKMADCRDFPSDAGCTLTISGSEDEVLAAAVQHAVSAHGHEDTPEVRDWLRANLKDEAG